MNIISTAIQIKDSSTADFFNNNDLSYVDLRLLFSAGYALKQGLFINLFYGLNGPNNIPGPTIGVGLGITYLSGEKWRWDFKWNPGLFLGYPNPTDIFAFGAFPLKISSSYYFNNNSGINMDLGVNYYNSAISQIKIFNFYIGIGYAYKMEIL